MLPNVPANLGQVKARATCVQNGVTTSGESAFFTLTANTAANLPPIILGSSSQIPVFLSVAPTTPSLTSVGQTVQLTVTGTYPDGSTQNLTASSTGTNYTTSNPAIATISPSGLVTAISSGTIVIQASNDGASGITTAMVMLAGASNGGISNSWAIANGLNPNDPTLPFQDPDRDGLTNLQEYQKGTDPNKADTDGDGLLDGDEVSKYRTNPLISDTDGDGIPDGVEITTGTDPLDKNSYDLKKAVGSSSVSSAFTLTTTITNQNPSIQLSWKVTLLDGKTVLDLIADPRTSISSSSLLTCNFNSQRGVVLAGNNGSCTITLSQSTLSVAIAGTVNGFSPAQVSTLSVPGSVAIDVAGSFAYIAAGTNGLIVVDVTDRTAPRVRGTLSGIGNAQAVRASGQTVYIADASGFLRIVSAINPDAPSLISSIAISGTPSALAVHGASAVIAAQAAGISIVNVASATGASVLGRLATPSSAIGVDFDQFSGLAAIAMGTSGLQLADLSSPSTPKLLGSLPGGDVRRVVLKLPAALLADTQRSVTSVNVSNPNQPILSSSLPGSLGGVPSDIAAFGNTALTADLTFGRAIPIISISSPLTPTSVGFWGLQSPGFSSSIAVDISFAYLIIPANGLLQILKYQNITDTLGLPPAISITSPSPNPALIQGQTVTFSANATDDIAVASVNFLVNGLPVFSSTSAPYQFSYTVPSSQTMLTFSATAVDYGNNFGAAPNVPVQVIPDPLTSVRGRVVDGSGSPVSGATVSALGQTGTTLSNGTFGLLGLPTIKGQIAVRVHVTVNGNVLGGLSALFAAVPGGTITTGDISVRPIPSITSISPRSMLAGTSTTVTITGVNLANSTFSFGGSTLAIAALATNQLGTTATFTLTVNANASGRFTLIGTNPAGSSDPTQVIGFLSGAPTNTISVPGSSPTADADGDGLSNAQEITLGTDPLGADTDADGWPDGLEVALGSDPLMFGSIPSPKVHWVSSFFFSMLDNLNPSARIPGSKQYISSLIFSMLNALDPSAGVPAGKNYVSSKSISMLNAVNPSAGIPGSKQYVSGLTFSMLNALNPSSGISAGKNYVSSKSISLLNALNPSAGIPGSKQYISGVTFSMLSAISPAPTKPSLSFVSGLPFSIFNSFGGATPGFFSSTFAKEAIALRVARPPLFPESSLGLLDSDMDGVSDVDELHFGTNPFDSDSDHDGYPDGLEIALGSDPLDPKSIPNLSRPTEITSPIISIDNRGLQAMKQIWTPVANLRRMK